MGSPPLVSFAQARDLALDNRRLARAGGDPLAAKRDKAAVPTFAEAVERFLDTKLAEFRNEKHRLQWRSSLDTYAGPDLGAIQVSDIGLQDILRTLDPIWREKTETASRLRDRIEAVLSVG